MIRAFLARVTVIVAVVLLIGRADGRPTVAMAEDRLSEVGTYLIDLETGQRIRVGENALIAWSPDSALAAVSQNGGDPTRPPLRLIAVADGAEQNVAIPERADVNQMRWAPDGSRLAVTLSLIGSRLGPVMGVVDPKTGAFQQFATTNIGEIAWTPDSSGITTITMDDAGGSVVTIDAGTGEVREAIPEIKDASCQRGLTWSPDGRFLAFGGPGLREGCGDVGNWGVWTWEPATRTVRHLFRGASDAPLWLANGEIVAIVSEPRPDGVPPLSLFRFAPTGGEPRPIAGDIVRMFPQPPRLVQVVGSTVLYPVSTCDTGEAYIWSPARDAPARLTREDVYAYRPALSPGATSLAFVRIGQQSELVVAPVGGGEPRVPLTSAGGLELGTASPWGAGDDWSPDGRWLAIEVTGEQFRDCIE